MSVRRVLSIFEPADLPILRKRCKPVADFGPATQALIDDLLDTWADCSAYGIAAPQIGVSSRVVVARAADAEQPIVLVNPKISRARDEETDYDGCLSIPGIYADTSRARRIHVEARDRRGERIAFDTAGFDARIIQHELDHLDGILFIDRLAKVDDLYRLVAKSDSEESERAPLTEAQAAAVRAQIRALPPDALRWR